MAPTTTELVEWLRTDGQLVDVAAADRDPSWMDARGLAAAATGWVTIGADRGELEVRITKDFPSRLPSIAVSTDGPFAGAPHVGASGLICYRQDERVMADAGRLADIVREAVNLAMTTLRTGREAAPVEYANEITAYWKHSFQRIPTYISLIDPGDEPRLIVSSRDRSGARLFLESHDQLGAFAPARRREGQVCNALYVPIDLPTRPGFHPKALATPAGFLEYVLPILARGQHAWRDFVRHIRGASVDVLLGVKRTLGRRGVIGIGIQTLRRLDESILLSADQCRFSAFLVEPADRPFLVPRGGGSLELADKKVLLVGCGSVGGHVSLALARAGIGQLDLVDPDNFETANTHRHVCGRAHWLGSKSDGLKQEIERLLPYVEVRSHRSNILDMLARDPNLLARYDLVVSATGAPLTDRGINEVVQTTPGAPPALFAWLEPYGIGAHVLAVNVAGRRRGCFECLHYEDRDGFACQVAFAAPDMVYGQDAMGCGGQFVPFGDLHANRLALRVVERALELLAGSEDGGLISSKGSVRAFHEAGFRTTKRYDTPGTELTLSSHQLARSDCSVCGP